MALLTPQLIDVTGLNAAHVAAAGGGDWCAPGQGLFLSVKNGSGASVTVTVVRPGTQYGQANPDVPVVIAAAGQAFIRMPAEFADTDGLIDVTYSAVTSVTVALCQAMV